MLNFLEIEGITKSFEGLTVLQGIDIRVDEGEIVGLIGPNGAGKSSLFNVITGFYVPDSGQIRFRGKNLIGLQPHRVCRSGVTRTFQLVRIFPSMSVLNNVLVGAIYGKATSRRQAMNKALESLRVLDLLDKKDTIAAHLTYSDRRLLEIARALAAEPRIVLLDEPLAGLNPAETFKLTAMIHELRNRHGITVLWIEHKMDAILTTCERIVVLDYGKKIAEGRPREIVNNKQVIEAYLGEPVA